MPAAHRAPIESKITIKQHPLHPMMVVFPSAFLISTVFTDAVFWWRSDPFWAHVSFWLAAAGFATGVLAALLGAADFVQIKEVRRHIAGWSHLMIAVMALALAGANVQLRIADPVAAVLPWGILVSGVMMVAVMITGWLGGTLTFRHGIGTYWHELDREHEHESEENTKAPKE